MSQIPPRHWAKHGGPITWCGIQVRDAGELAPNGRRWNTKSCPQCAEAYHQYRLDRMVIQKRIFTEEGVTTEALEAHENEKETERQKFPSLRLPSNPSPSWWAQYRIGLSDGLNNIYHPKSAVAAAHGYDAGHFDGTFDRKSNFPLQRAYDRIEAESADL